MISLFTHRLDYFPELILIFNDRNEKKDGYGKEKEKKIPQEEIFNFVLISFYFIQRAFFFKKKEKFECKRKRKKKRRKKTKKRKKKRRKKEEKKIITFIPFSSSLL